MKLPWKARFYCSECMCTTTHLLAETAGGRKGYLCNGNLRDGRKGCGHWLELSNVKDDEDSIHPPCSEGL